LIPEGVALPPEVKPGHADDREDDEHTSYEGDVIHVSSPCSRRKVSARLFSLSVNVAFSDNIPDADLSQKEKPRRADPAGL
jgi:hypothetical protein